GDDDHRTARLRLASRRGDSHSRGTGIDALARVLVLPRMSHVLVLTADPAGAPLDHTTPAAGAAALAEAGAAVAAKAWPAPALACEIRFEGCEPEAATTAVRRALGGTPVDVNVVPVRDRRKSLLLADMESTLIENEMLDDLAAMIGIGDEVAEITRRAMNGE